MRQLLPSHRDESISTQDGSGILTSVTRSCVLGALYGHLLGDALGVPYEFRSPSDIGHVEWTGFGTHNQPPGTWSDDGALMLCQVASLVECDEFDPQDTGERFVRWRDEGYQAAGGVVFDIGGTTSMAIQRLREGVPALDAGPTDKNSNGNGSLMRILPIGLWFHDADAATLVKTGHESSRITHGHPRSQVCCALHNLALRGLLRHEPPETALSTALRDLERVYASDDVFRAELGLVCDYSERTGSGYVVDCWWSAWEALVRTDTFVDCVTRAVGLGDDTDTTAAVAGGLAGAVYGVEALPVKWLSELGPEPEQRTMMERFASKQARKKP